MQTFINGYKISYKKIVTILCNYTAEIRINNNKDLITLIEVGKYKINRTRMLIS
ncbi:hypothetical protein NUSPORA_01717 [Nucleospora cyclopteri]